MDVLAKAGDVAMPADDRQRRTGGDDPRPVMKPFAVPRRSE